MWWPLDVYSIIAFSDILEYSWHFVSGEVYSIQHYVIKFVWTIIIEQERLWIFI